MEGPLLTKSEYIVNVGGSSSSVDDVRVYVIARTAWYCFLFVVTLVLTVAAIALLTMKNDEQNQQKIFVTLLIGYICASVATLPILCWFLWKFCRNFGSEPRIKKVIINLKTMLEYFFVGWVVVLLWHLFYAKYTTQHLWLWITFIAFSFIRDVIPNLKCASICFLYPMLQHISGIVDFMEAIDNIIMFYVVVGGFIVVIIVCIIVCIIAIIWRIRDL